MLSGRQVAEHSGQNDLWMIISGHVYDLTEVSAGRSAPFAADIPPSSRRRTPEARPHALHQDLGLSLPTGIKILLKHAGKDATEEYVRARIHP